MAWFNGKVPLGNFPDFTEAVNKLSESVKNIEKNFGSSLGLDGKRTISGDPVEASGPWPSSTDSSALFEPIMGFVGQKSGEGAVDPLEKSNSSMPASPLNEKEIENDILVSQGQQTASAEEINEEIKESNVEKESGAGLIRESVQTDSVEEIKDTGGEQKYNASADHSEAEVVPPSMPFDVSEDGPKHVHHTECANLLQEKERSEEISTILKSVQPESTSPAGQLEGLVSVPTIDDANGLPVTVDEEKAQEKDVREVFLSQARDTLPKAVTNSRESSASDYPNSDKTGDDDDNSRGSLPPLRQDDVEASEAVFELVTCEKDAITKSIDQKKFLNDDIGFNEQRFSSGSNSYVADSVAELEKVKNKMNMTETVLQGAAGLAQAKADEIAILMSENEQLKYVIDDLRRKINETETQSQREEFHQRVAALERKVYVLTKERDTLRREQSKKSNAAAFLKEKDEIISQVMTEGEELSKKQAAQESQIRKLRAQIRELEQDMKGMLTKLQVEENEVESIERGKVKTEKLLQETVEKHRAELTTQKEFYTTALNADKEAEALAVALANNEATIELESHLREAEDRETMLVQALDELRQTLTIEDQHAVFKEDMLHKDIEDLQKRYHASECRCDELITQVPESTRPLLRQIGTMQETAARKAEAWTAAERSLNSRLQNAEAKGASAEEREQSITERLTQTLSRINVLEAQISCLRAEQTQLTKSLEKERQKATEDRQDYLALKGEDDTHKGHVNQLKEEVTELRRMHKDELHEALKHQELLQKALERERTALDKERAARLQSSAVNDQNHIARQKSAAFENGNSTRKISSASSLSSMEESYFLQTTLDSSDNFFVRRSDSEGTMSSYHMKNMAPNTFVTALRQKKGELAFYMSRLASMESTRNSLAEELVKLNAQSEKLRSEAAAIPGIRAELEALRWRHSAALELMGERDEELEELRADIVDVKEMYREQVNILVNKIQISGTSIGAA